MPQEHTHILINKTHKPLFKKAAERYGKSQGDIAAAALEFILKNRFDPDNFDDKSVVDVVKTLKSDVIAYIKTQEKNILKPLLDQVKSLDSTSTELIGVVQTRLPKTQEDSQVPEQEKEVVATPQPSPSPLAGQLTIKNKQIEVHFSIMNELKGAFSVKNGQYRIELPQSRVDELLESFFSS